MKKNRIYELDIMRGVCALMVVFFHYTTQYEVSIRHLEHYPVNLPWGNMAVSVFFMLSGFLILMHIKETDTFFSFGYSRIVRLFPTYWVGIIITSIAMYYILPDWLRPMKTILMNFTMLEGYFGFDWVDGVYWTLPIELLFYALVGFLILFKQKKNIIPICFGWLCFSIFFSIIRTRIDGSAIYYVSEGLLSGYSQMFAAGIMLYQLYKNKNGIMPHVVIGLCVVNQYLNRGLNYTIFFVVVIGIFYLIAYKAKLLKYRKPSISEVHYARLIAPIVFIANISYPLYLVHQYIGYGIIKNMEKAGLTNEIYLVIPITISIILAFLLHKLIEVPSAKLLMKMISWKGQNGKVLVLKSEDQVPVVEEPRVMALK